MGRFLNTVFIRCKEGYFSHGFRYTFFSDRPLRNEEKRKIESMNESEFIKIMEENGWDYAIKR